MQEWWLQSLDPAERRHKKALWRCTFSLHRLLPGGKSAIRQRLLSGRRFKLISLRLGLNVPHQLALVFGSFLHDLDGFLFFHIASLPFCGDFRCFCFLRCDPVFLSCSPRPAAQPAEALRLPHPAHERPQQPAAGPRLAFPGGPAHLQGSSARPCAPVPPEQHRLLRQRGQRAPGGGRAGRRRVPQPASQLLPGGRQWHEG